MTTTLVIRIVWIFQFFWNLLQKQTNHFVPFCDISTKQRKNDNNKKYKKCTKSNTIKKEKKREKEKENY